MILIVSKGGRGMVAMVVSDSGSFFSAPMSILGLNLLI